jgi:nitric oxide reductase NorD protein
MPRPRNRSLLWRMRHRVERRLRALVALVPRRSEEQQVSLDEVKERLEYYLRAVYGRPIRVEPVAVDKPRAGTREAGWLMRKRIDAVSDSDVDVIRLPSQLVAPPGEVTPFERFRCIAVQHAERLVRSTASHAATLGSDLERDLFQLAEAASVDRRIAATQPGLRPAMDAGRRSGLQSRGAHPRTDLERRVERLLAIAMSGAATANDQALPAAESAGQSAEWARRTADELARRAPADASRYRRIAPLGMWHTAILGAGAAGSAAGTAAGQSASPTPGAPLPPPRPPRRRRPRPVGAPEQMDTEEDPTRSDGEEAATNDPNARALADAPPSESGPTSADSDAGDAPPDPDAKGDSERGGSTRKSPPPPGRVYRYPEWDAYAKTFHPEGATVRAAPPTAPASDWAREAAAEHVVLIRQVRERFGQLRAQRLRLRRQPNGDEIDLDACVTAFSDRAAGRSPDDRLYATVRMTRRELAILLLVDASASTSARIDAAHRVLDIERLSALVAAEAFDALGDAYAIGAFSSNGRADVRVAEIKGFGERNSALTGARLAALEPANATRLGAALRHATAELAERPESHRLLLVLSDGRPNDQEGYIDEDYAVEDSRRAVAEARLSGVTCYCITIDPEEPREYVGKIFGDGGYRALARTSHLPEVLLQAVQGLLQR